jgi:hypothetical protein
MRCSFLAVVVDRFYTSNAEDTKRIRAVILSDDLMMTSLMTGRNPIVIIWNREKVTRRMQNTLRQMIIAALIIMFIVMFMYSCCYVCSVLYILFSSCQLPLFGYPV